MARQAIKNTLSPAGTVSTPTETFSNVINTDAGRDARIYVELEALNGATELDVQAQIAEVSDPTKFVAVKGVANPFTAPGRQVISLAEQEVGKFLRLRYIPDAGAPTLNAILETKEGN